MTEESVRVRYIVNNVDTAIEFYTKLLNFKTEMHPAPEFAILSLGDFRLFLSKLVDVVEVARICPTGHHNLPVAGIESQ